MVAIRWQIVGHLPARMENFRLEGWFFPQETGFFDAMAQLALPISGILSGVDTQEGFRRLLKKSMV